MTENLSPQHVVRLTVESFKRLTDVAIVPDAATPTVQITGRNTAGKSSVLDALETVFTGVDKRSTPRPVHDGATTARIVAETQDLKITRTFKAKDGADTTSTLTVTAKDGAKYSSPQKMLDDLLGAVSVDPVEFAEMDPKKQRATLLRLVELPFDLDAVDTQRAGLYAQRTGANRDVKALEAQLSGMPDVPEDYSTEEVSAGDLIQRITRAREHQIELREAAREADDLHEKARRLREELNRVETARDLADAKVERLSDVEVENPAELEVQLAGIEETNQKARDNARVLADRMRVVKALAEARNTARGLDHDIRHLDEQKAKGLAAARFPVEGLGFTEEGITYQGVPFEQASTAERIRVSVAVATAKPGTIRVLLIRRGESLDSQNLELIGQLAAEQGYQVWIEKVQEERSLGVWHLEDGRLAQ